MQEQDPYAAPPADIAGPAPKPRLAGRGERLGGAIIDALIVLVIVLPAMYFSGYFHGMMSGVRPGFGMQAMWALIGFALFVVIQGAPLSSNGQTWGKKLLRMKIVDLAGNTPDFGRLVLLRYGVGAAIQLVPFVGGLYWIVDSLFIFGEDKRCIHDLIAGTRVVVVPAR
jgi:uncharacterized RDD family membrane protein YckC